MPKRQNTHIVNAEIVQGDDAYVKVISPTVGDMKAYQEQVQGLQRAIDVANEQGDAKRAQDLQLELNDLGMSLFSQYVVEWNWVNDDGDPLPQPKTDNQVYNALTPSEVAFLAEAVSGVMTQQKKDA